MSLSWDPGKGSVGEGGAAGLSGLGRDGKRSEGGREEEKGWEEDTFMCDVTVGGG